MHRPARLIGVSVCALMVMAAAAAPAAHEPPGFSLGVAAGDVTDTAALLWTRADQAGPVLVRVATDETLVTIVAFATADATPERDLTVKIDITGLTPATRYFYRFERADQPSVVSRLGVFRTAPAAADPRPVRFAFSGDSNFRRSPLGILHFVPAEDPDLFIWFGDTLYADSASGDLGVATTLEHYRAKYRQMRSDPYVRELLAAMAVWTGWDDHEVVNDYAGTDPALAVERRAAAYQAFFEYMPIRPAGVADDPYRTYRRARYGAQVEFFFLDDRQYRDVSAFGACPGEFDPLGFVLGPLIDDARCAELLRAPRSMLGDAQREWLLTSLAESSAPRKFVVDSVVFSHLGVYPYDRWDGYDHERRRIIEAIDAAAIEGVTFLSTDIHASLHNPDMTRFFRRQGYELRNGVRLAEITVGPIGTDTFLEEIISGGAGILRQDARGIAGLVGLFEPVLKAKLRCVSGITFFEPDRFSYGVIDIAPDSAQVTIRGLPPARAQHDDPNRLPPEPERLHTAELDRGPVSLPCALPLFAILGAAFALLNGSMRQASPGRSDVQRWRHSGRPTRPRSISGRQC